MKNKLLSMMLVLVVSLSAMAQTSLKGVVIDQGTQTPVVGAKVTLAGQNIFTTTNAQGEFQLLFLEPIDEEVIIEADGYVAALELVQLQADQTNQMEAIQLQQDIVTQAQDEILLNLTEEEMSDDEGRSQAQASSSSASTDVFNATTSFAWSTARYRNRGYESNVETYYIEGLNFNSQERGSFNYSAMGGLNDASRYKEVLNPMEASSFTFGGIGQSTNYMMGASRFAQGWKVGAAGTNRNYKARVNATYATGIMPSGWAVIAQLAYRFSPYVNQKGIIGEGIKYYSLGYFLAAEKVWTNSRHKLITFGAPTERGQNAAVTQEVYDLTGSIYYNPYWGYQNGKVRNSRIVKSFDPTVIASYEVKFRDYHQIKVAAGYHYSWYSNSALNYYNAPDPRPDYYRNLPSFLWDGQIANPWSEASGQQQLYDENGNQYPWGLFIGEDLNGNKLGNGFVGHDGNIVGPSVNERQYNNLVDLWKKRDDKTTQIDWESIYAANIANNQADPTGSARYVLERRHNDIEEASASFNYVNTKYNHLKMTLGVEEKYSMGLHYKTIDDLLGGDRWIDIDAFADRDIKELASSSGFTQEEIAFVRQNEIRNGYTDTIKANGAAFGYNYQMHMSNTKAWFQNEWSFNEVDLYYALQLNYSYMQRSTMMLNGRAWYLTTLAEQNGNPNAWRYYGRDTYKKAQAGDSRTTKAGHILFGEAHHFFDPAFKLGLTYKINGRNRLKVNALAETRAPYARDAYISQRVHDAVINNIYVHDNAKNLKDFYAASEKVVSADLTYEFNYPVVRGRVTGFFTQSWDGTELNGYYDDEARTFVNQALTDIDKRYMGIEAALSVKLGTYFTLTGATSVGDYRYTSDANSITSAENGMPMTQDATQGLIYETYDKVLLKGLHLSTGPQVNASLKLSFFHSKMWFADVTVSYHDWNHLSVAPSRRMQGLYTGVRTDGTMVNGWFGDGYANAIQTIDGKPLGLINIDENGNVDYANAQLDANGVPVLKYPYSLMTMQENLAATNPLNRFLIDASVGKLIYLKNRQSVSINLSVTNLTNNTHFKTGGYQQARLPRAVRQGVDDYKNSVITANAWKYPSKYYYAWGVNFFLSVTYKF